MTTLLFANFLMFALFAAGLWFVYRSVKREIREYVRSNNRINRKRVVDGMRKVEAVEAKVGILELHVRKDKTIPAFSTNPFEKMEQRYEKDFNTVVSVNDEQVNLGSDN